jgi:hypothetical protein
VYIPKHVILGLLYAVACVVGWLLHGSLTDTASAAPAPAVLSSSPTVGGPPVTTQTIVTPAARTIASVIANPNSATSTSVAVPAVIATGAGTPVGVASTTSPPSSPQSSGYVATPGSAFSLTTRPDEANPGVPISTGQVASAGSTFSLTTGPSVSQGGGLPAGGDHPADAPRAVPGVAQAGPGGVASYPLAVPSPVLSGSPSISNGPSSPLLLPPAELPTLATNPFPVTYPGSNAMSSGQPLSVEVPSSSSAYQVPAVGELSVIGPASYLAPILAPLPGAGTRGIAFSEWESYRTDLAGRNIVATTDDSNVFINRNGNLNANTGDTDASGLNVTDATNSVIRGTESADEAPYQTAAAAIVDLASDDPGGGLGSDPDDEDEDEDEDDDGDANESDPGANGIAPVAAPTQAVAAPDTAMSAPAASEDTDTGDSDGDTDTAVTPDTDSDPGDAPGPQPAAPVTPAPGASAVVPADGDGDPDDSQSEEFDFPYEAWTQQISSDAASAVHTDEGTTLASGADAVVVGGDGYDDDDNRAVGENIVLTRDDSNVVLGGTGDVNAQIGDSEQGAVIMGVDGVFIQGGGAY